MYQIRAGAGSVTPSLTVAGGNTDSYNVVSIALKSATAGTTPSASPRILGLQIEALPISTSGTFSQIQFPCTGTTILAMWDGEESGAGTSDLTAVTDGNANIWTRGATLNAPLQGTDEDAWYTTNASCSTTMTGPHVTIRNQTSPNFHSMLALYDTTGLKAAGPFDVSASTTGNQAVTGNLTTVSITPSTSGGLVLATSQINSHTLSGCVNSTTYLCDMSVASSTNGNDDSWWEANGLAHVYNTNTSTLTFVYTVNFNTSPNGVGTWGALAAAFKAAP
jgi:hypothetical protein